MGNHVIKVPDVGEGIAEVELVGWAVVVGQTVGRNQVLAEVMTDKANVEIPSPVDGVIANLHGDVGAILAVGSPLIELTVAGAGDPGAPPGELSRTDEHPAGRRPGEHPADRTAEFPAGGAAPAAAAAGGRAGPTFDEAKLRFSAVANGESAPAATNSSPADTSGSATSNGEPGGDVTGLASSGEPGGDVTGLASSGEPGRGSPGGHRTTSGRPAGTGGPRSSPPRAEGEKPLASPAVRHRARNAGIDLRMVPGSGPAGRITHEDLDRFWHEAEGSGRSTPGRRREPDMGTSEEPIVGLRRQIATRMVAATTTIPHITYVDEVDVTALESLRAALNERSGSSPRLTLLPFLVRALVDAIVDFPTMNAHVDDDAETLTTYGGVHVGIATQTENGLVVPVVRHAEAMSLVDLADRIAELADLTRARKASPTDLTGSTITITSLGPLGGLVTTPVINKPEVAIVGVNKIVDRPVVVDGQVVVRKMMNLSSSFDHRIIDGWDAASFIQQIRRSLEEPALLFVGDDYPSRPPSSGEA